MAYKQIKSIDSFLEKVPKDGYNCHDFSREVWLFLTGEDVKEKLDKLIGAFINRKLTASQIKDFTILTKPESPCFVVMQRRGFVPHIGVFYEGRILHLGNRAACFEFPSIAKGYFKRIRYYK